MANIITGKMAISSPCDTKANWEDANPIIPAGLLVIESDTMMVKVGNDGTYKEASYVGGTMGSNGDATAETVNDKAIRTKFNIEV